MVKHVTRCTEHLHNRVKNTHSHTTQLLSLLLVKALNVVLKMQFNLLRFHSWVDLTEGAPAQRSDTITQYGL